MRTVVLDTGALIASQRRDRSLAQIISAAVLERASIVVPASVVAECWRYPPSYEMSQLLKIASPVKALDDAMARSVGELNGEIGRVQIADAHVARLAVAMKPSYVITSDPDDLEALIRACGVSVSPSSRAKSRTAVVIDRI